MSKLTNEQRSQLQSARAKNRKASVILGNAAAEFELNVPKSVIKHIQALEDYYAKALAPAAKSTAKADPSETHDTPIAEAA